LCPALDAGFFIFWGLYLKETRKTELEGEVAWVSGFVLTNPELKKADSVSPTRQVSATAEAFRWTRNETFFDNRKAGKSTPTIVT